MSPGRSLRLALVLAVGSGLACGPSGPRVWQGRVVEVYADADCGRDDEQASVRWVEDTPELQRRLEQATAGAESGAPGAARPAPGSLLVLVETGRKPTGGYALSLADPMLRVEKGLARLRVGVREPEPGDDASAWPSSPCLVVALPKGEFNTLEVVDAAGLPIGTLAVPRPGTERKPAGSPRR